MAVSDDPWATRETEDVARIEEFRVLRVAIICGTVVFVSIVVACCVIVALGA